MGYSRGQRAIETVAIAAVILLGIPLAARVCWIAIDTPACVALAAFVALVGADFASGLVHWFGDTWGDERWPIVGRSLIRGFREHHADQRALLDHDFVEASGAISLGLTPILGAAYAIPVDSFAGRLALSFVVVFAAAVFWTNEIHKWAHRDAPPKLVGRLQKLRVLLPPEKHAIHHAGAHDDWYCITTGWLNRPLSSVDFFRTLERMVTRWTGAEPRAYELTHCARSGDGLNRAACSSYAIER